MNAALVESWGAHSLLGLRLERPSAVVGRPLPRVRGDRAGPPASLTIWRGEGSTEQ